MGSLACPCGHRFSTTACPDESMKVIRERDREAYSFHSWRSYQLCDIDHGGMLPPRGSSESEDFHESLDACLGLEGTLWECPTCGRLLFRLAGQDSYRVFIPDHGSPSRKAAPSFRVSGPRLATDKNAEPSAAPERGSA
jgi:hypothetical protein